MPLARAEEARLQAQSRSSVSQRRPGGKEKSLAPPVRGGLPRTQEKGAAQVRTDLLSTAAARGHLSSLPPTLSTKSRGAVLTCQHAGEEHGWEVMVEVEDPAHQEEREVMEHPAKQQLTASLQQDLGQP